MELDEQELAKIIIAHWKANDRTLYKELVEAGDLKERALARAKFTLEAYHRMIEQGFPEYQAQDFVMREWALSVWGRESGY